MSHELIAEEYEDRMGVQAVSAMVQVGEMPV